MQYLHTGVEKVQYRLDRLAVVEPWGCCKIRSLDPPGVSHGEVFCRIDWDFFLGRHRRIFGKVVDPDSRGIGAN